MKRTILAIGSTMMMGMLLMSGCGGGDDEPSATPVVLKFSTYSSALKPAQATGINSVQFRVMLPMGVTVATDPLDAKWTANGVLKLSGVLTTTFKNITAVAYPRPLQGTYSAAKPAGSGPNAIRVNLTFIGNPVPTFNPGEFLTVNYTAAPGVNPVKSDFSFDKLVIGDKFGNDLRSEYPNFGFTMTR
jgi:hypothetical protein